MGKAIGCHPSVHPSFSYLALHVSNRRAAWSRERRRLLQDAKAARADALDEADCTHQAWDEAFLERERCSLLHAQALPTAGDAHGRLDDAVGAARAAALDDRLGFFDQPNREALLPRGLRPASCISRAV